METPETQPDAGTGEETVVPETTSTEEVTETPADDSADGDGSSVDAEDGGHETAGTKVPYARFYKVNEAKKTLAAENERLKQQIAALQPKEPARPATPADRLKRVLRPAPSDLSTLEQMELYNLDTLEAHAPELIERWFEQKFGMKPEQAAATLTHTTQTTREQIIHQFETAAKARGLDPRSSALKDAVGVLMDTGKYQSFEAAMDTFKPATPAPKPTPRINGKGAEVDTVDLAGLSRVRALPRNAAEASKLAQEGKRIEQMSVQEILRQTQGGS